MLENTHKTNEEKLIELVNTNNSWIRLPEELYKTARKMAFEGKIEWYERTKEARKIQENEEMKKEENNSMVSEALGALDFMQGYAKVIKEAEEEHSAPKLSVLDRQLQKLNPGSEYVKFQIRDFQGNVTNWMDLDKPDFAKLKEFLKTLPYLNS